MNNNPDLKTFEKVSKNIKRQSILLIVIAFLIIGFLVSYALLNFDVTLFGNKQVSLSTCSLDVDFKEENAIDLVEAIPISDADALNYEPFLVTLTNNDSGCGAIPYRLTMIDLCTNCSLVSGICTIGSTTCNCNTGFVINPTLIKYQVVNTSTSDVYSGTNPFTLDIEDTLLAGTTTVVYEVRLWIVESAINSDLYVHNGCSVAGGITSCNWDYNIDGTYKTKNFGAKINLEV